MPNKDGFEATSEILALDANSDKKTPIIALTANAMESDRHRCLNAGMSDFVPKPFNKDVLFTALHNWIYLKLEEPLPEQSEETISPIEHGMGEPLDPTTLDVLKEAMGEDFGDLIPAYLDSCDEIFSDMEKAFHNQDQDAIQLNAHSLKSSCANMGAMNLSASAKKIEDNAKDGKIPDNIAFLEALKIEAERVKYALEQYQK